MKKLKKSLTILSCLSATVLVTTPIVAASCAVDDSSPKLELELDTSQIADSYLAVDGNNVSCSLKAKYNKKIVQLTNVSFTYSVSDILTATWSKSTQKVELIPNKKGSTTLTINAKDKDSHTVTANVPLVVHGNNELAIDDSDFQDLDLYAGDEVEYITLTAAYENAIATISEVKFPSYDKKIVSLSHMGKGKIQIRPLSEGNTIAKIVAIDSKGRVGTLYKTLYVKPTKTLILDKSAFTEIKDLYVEGDPQSFPLSARYGNEDATISDVTFEYSQEGIIDASWDNTNKKVVITPLKKEGSVKLTLNAVDDKHHTASEQVIIPVVRKKVVEVDKTSFAGISLVDEGKPQVCKLTATYDGQAATINTINFSYQPEGVVTAEWNKQNQEVTITPEAEGATILTLNVTDINNHTGVASIPLTVNAKPVEYQLVLNTSTFNGIELIETGDDVSCKLSATYGEDATLLNTVAFSYSEEGIVSADWDKDNQNVILSPVGEGSTTLTMTATDDYSHSATATVDLIVKPKPIEKTLQINASAFNGIQLYAGEENSCSLTATYGDDPATLTNATFSYSQEGILTASWDNGKVKLNPTNAGNVTLTINATDGEHNATIDVPLTVNAAKKLELNLQNLAKANVVEGDYSVNCLLGATYGFEPIQLKTVTFSYAPVNILKANWDQATQNVELSPIQRGALTLTLNATDKDDHITTQNIDLVVQPNDAVSLGISTGTIPNTQNQGANNTYQVRAWYWRQEVELASLTFSYSTNNIIDVTWSKDGGKSYVTIKSLNMGVTNWTLNFTDIYGRSGTKTVTITVDSKVHEFINNRTFTIRGWRGNAANNGTAWLFYHLPYEKAGNNYTYYALTNNHVTSGIVSLGTGSTKVSVGYQDWATEAKGDSSTIYFWGDSTSGESNQYNTVVNGWNNSDKNAKFRTLFSSYLKSSTKDYYRDMTVCKLDLSDYANTPMATNRLDALNTYGEKHNNYLLEFDDYSDITSASTVSIFSGGFPSKYLDQNKGEIYSSALKFQKQYFTNMGPIGVFNNMQSIINYFDSEAAYYTWSLYDATGVYHANTAYQMSVDFYTRNLITNSYVKFGPGASGSLGIRTTNPDDENTYKATGIYWGGWYGNTSYFSFYVHYSPFKLNFGKNLGGIETDFIQRFFSSIAYTEDTPYNDLIN